MGKLLKLLHEHKGICIQFIIQEVNLD
jgi:hypothetical protein